MSATGEARPRRPRRVRIVTAASLFDGHDAAINIMRRILQGQGAEVIHLGHDRSVDEIVGAAIQEDADAVAVSSYQGGHMEFFGYLVDELARRGAGEIRVYGGGGGTISSEESRALQTLGVTRIFRPEDGRELGLEGMIGVILDDCRSGERRPLCDAHDLVDHLGPSDSLAIGRLISQLEEEGPGDGAAPGALRSRLDARASARSVPVIGFTGTGGSGKSSVIDELVRRFRCDFPEPAIGLVLVDPSRRRSGGALLGDRIRMNAIHAPGVYVRSMATRQAHLALSAAVRDAVRVLVAAQFDLVIVETAGIGQSDSEIIDLVDVSLYVMTPEYGAPSQLEKIDMIDLADVIVLNKYDRQGGRDALRDVRRQWKHDRAHFDQVDSEIPVFPTIARQWDDPGTDRLYEAVRKCVVKAGGESFAKSPLASAESLAGERGGAPEARPLLPVPRSRYLAEIASTVRDYRSETERQAERATDAYAIGRTLRDLGGSTPEDGQAFSSEDLEAEDGDALRVRLKQRYNAALDEIDPASRDVLANWPAIRARYAATTQHYEVRGRKIPIENQVETLSRSQLPRVATPRYGDWGEILRYLRLENLPGYFPFTAGVFPFKRQHEEPARMFAGEGPP
ncbi:MAG: cobalamin-dependent protein, partial [Myxococcota bacterium]